MVCAMSGIPVKVFSRISAKTLAKTGQHETANTVQSESKRQGHVDNTKRECNDFSECLPNSCTALGEINFPVISHSSLKGTNRMTSPANHAYVIKRCLTELCLVVTSPVASNQTTTTQVPFPTLNSWGEVYNNWIRINWFFIVHPDIIGHIYVRSVQCWTKAHLDTNVCRRIDLYLEHTSHLVTIVTIHKSLVN